MLLTEQERDDRFIRVFRYLQKNRFWKEQIFQEQTIFSKLVYTVQLE